MLRADKGLFHLRSLVTDCIDGFYVADRITTRRGDSRWYWANRKAYFASPLAPSLAPECAGGGAAGHAIRFGRWALLR
jgi:hypothetical protein